MYKRMGFFFFLFFSFCYNMKRKNRQDEHKCIFTFKKNCRPPSGSKYDPKQNKFNKKINADLWGVKQAVRWDGMLERLHIYDKEALTASITFFSFSSLKDAIEGFFDKVANSTKKITEWIS